MTRRTDRWVPVGLVALAAIAVLAGTTRLVEVFGGPKAHPADTRFAASPAPVVVHVAAAIGYALLGAFQFSAGIRRNHPGAASPDRTDPGRTRSRGRASPRCG